MGVPAGPQRLGERSVIPAMIVAAAAALRCFRLGALPPAHYRDVAATAMDALRAAAGDPRIHYVYDEGLYANLMAIVFLLGGPSDWTVRAPGALFGALTCWGVFRLGAALGMARAGLFGAALLAVSHWHLILSRSGFRAILLPLLLVHAAAFLVEGIRGGSRVRLIAGGVLFGLGVHVYPAVRFAPLIVPLYLAAESRRAPGGARQVARRFLPFALAAVVAALPMLAHYVRHPDDFNFPRRVVSVFSPKLEAGSVPHYLKENAVKTLLMLHVRGDANPRHNLPRAPLLDPLTGVLFVAGLAALWRSRSRAAPAAALVGSWIVAMLLPSYLSVEGVPHALRASGVLPGVALAAGAGAAAIEERLARRVGTRRALAVALGAWIALGGWTAYRYFGIWAPDPRTADAHDAPLRAASRVLLAAPPGVERLLVANGTGLPIRGAPAETQVFLFEMRSAPPAVLGPRDGGRLVLGGRPALVAFERRDDAALQVIRGLNPGATIVEVDAPGLSRESPVYRID